MRESHVLSFFDSVHVTTPSSSELIRHRIVVLQEEHRDLDLALRGLENARLADQLAMRRLKKRKLHLKDEIVRLQMLLVPDIHA